jgi:hypothetical protein
LSLSRDAFHRHDRPPGVGALVPRFGNPDILVNRENTSVSQRLSPTYPAAGGYRFRTVDVAVDRSASGT